MFVHCPSRGKLRGERGKSGKSEIEREKDREGESVNTGEKKSIVFF